MATLSTSPAAPVQGQEVVINGNDFLNDTALLVTVITPDGEVFTHDITSDADGDFGSTDLANPAVSTLTSDATNVTADDTVTIDGVVYTFKASVTTTAGQVKIGADAAATLSNLKLAINAGPTGSGTLWGSATVVHPTVKATDLTATTLKIVAKTPGTAGNSLATTEASSHLSWTSTVMASGAAATAGAEAFRMYVQKDGIYTVTASDGTNSVTTTIQVWKSA